MAPPVGCEELSSVRRIGRSAESHSRNQSPSRAVFSKKERDVIARYRTPRQVQRYLRELPYNWERGGETLRSFRSVVRYGSVHCLEGALTAAAILEQHGYPPLLLDLESKDNLDHVLFIYRRRGRWGSVGRSRETGLQGRKPVFRSLRDLVMSYVDPYVDRSGRITAFGVLDLRLLTRCDWRFSPRNVWKVEQTLIRLPHRKIKTSDRRYRRMLQRYLAFRKKHPTGPPLFYSNRDQWI